MPSSDAHETFLWAPLRKTPVGGVVAALGAMPRSQLTCADAVLLNTASLLVRTLVGVPLGLALLITVTWFDLWETPADLALRILGLTTMIGVAANAVRVVAVEYTPMGARACAPLSLDLVWQSALAASLALTIGDG